MRTCKKCKERKALENFTINKMCNPPFEHRCKKCTNEYKKKWENINPGRVRDSWLKSRFGMSLKEYSIILNKQQGKCAICKQPEHEFVEGQRVRSLAVDHNHATGAIRGLLCRRCNVSLGTFKDSKLLLKAAIKYLRKYE